MTIDLVDGMRRAGCNIERRVLIAVAAVAATIWSLAGSARAVPSPELEGSVSAPEWRVNAWGGVPAAYRIHNSDGVITLHVDAHGQDSHTQLYIPVTFTLGNVYRARLSLRAVRSTPVTLAFRQDHPPWYSLGQTTVWIGPQARNVEIDAIVPPGAEGAGSLRLEIADLAGGDIEIAGTSLGSQAKVDFGGERGEQHSPPFAFGMVVNKLTDPPHWPTLDLAFLRLWDTQTAWRDIEPKPGTWDFSRLDSFLDLAEAHHAQVMLTLGQTPAWAAMPGHWHCVYELGCAPPSIADWQVYVRRLAQRYGRRIKYWELWNEPDSGQFWEGSPAQLAAMAVVARVEIKQVRSDAVLLGPSITANGGIDFLDRFLHAGGGAALDAASFHGYYGGDAELVGHIFNIYKVLDSYGMSAVPLWNTEGAAMNGVQLECQRAAPDNFADVKALLLMRAMKVDHFAYYNWERQDGRCRRLAEASDYTTLTAEGEVLKAYLRSKDDETITALHLSAASTCLELAGRSGVRHIAWSSTGDFQSDPDQTRKVNSGGEFLILPSYMLPRSDELMIYPGKCPSRLDG